MKLPLQGTLTMAALALATQAAAQVVFYENDNFGGRSMTVEGQNENFDRSGFNDRASSVVVYRDRWEVCTDARFQGRCTILRPGRYPSLNDLGLNDRISSVRPVDKNARVADQNYAPPPQPVYDNYPRHNERLHQEKVTSVRAIYGGQPEQRCWVEQQQEPAHSSANIPGAVIGGVLGGVIGHQVGSGRGNDLATVGGAVAGAAIGANVGRDNGDGYTHAVRRCENVASSGKPDHWDVTYMSGGVEHRMQTTYQPGPTVTVNAQGEPRS
jgi:uncharacterized protein YcfJ